MRVGSIYFVFTGALGGAVGFLLMEGIRQLLELFSATASAEADTTQTALRFAVYGLAVGAALGMTQGLYLRRKDLLRRGLLIGGVLGILGGFAGGLIGEWLYDLVPSTYVVDSKTDLAVVLDSSGSMGILGGANDPWGQRKKAARQLAERLSDNDRLAIIDFDHEARLAFPLTRLGDPNVRKKIKKAIGTIDSSGGTDLGAGMALALQQLVEHRAEGRPQSIIFLTDGQGEGEYDPAITEAASRAGITIFTVGLGSSVDRNLLESIAKATGGSFYPVSKAQNLIDLFYEIATRHNNMLEQTGATAPAEGKETTSPVLLWCARTLAWAVMGLLLGWGQGIRENSWQDMRACSRGGALGGLLGGALFDPATHAISGTLGVLAARAGGSILVGALIGGSMRFFQAAAETRMAKKGETRAPIISGLRMGSDSDARRGNGSDSRQRRSRADRSRTKHNR